PAPNAPAASASADVAVAVSPGTNAPSINSLTPSSWVITRAPGPVMVPVNSKIVPMEPGPAATLFCSCIASSAAELGVQTGPAMTLLANPVMVLGLATLPTSLKEICEPLAGIRVPAAAALTHPGFPTPLTLAQVLTF